MEKHCLHCGGLFIAYRSGKTAGGWTKYCSVSCSRAACAKPELTCIGCGEKFTPKQSDRVHYCSRECAYKHKSALSRARKESEQQTKIVWIRQCQTCGNRYFKSRNIGNTCGEVCREKRQRMRWQISQPSQAFTCRQCGLEYTPTHRGRNTFCSPRCAKRYDKNIRKLKLKSQTPDRLCIEPFGPWEIYRRDKFICQICGDKVNLAAPVLDNYAPSIDHIVPVSKGGHHVRSNVQCAHRFCNALKNDKPMEHMFFAINRMGRAGSETSA